MGRKKVSAVTSTELPSKEQSDNAAIDVLTRDLVQSRQWAHQLVSALEQPCGDGGARGIRGLSPERTLLLEEHMANIVLHWIAHQDPQDIEQIPLRDFSQLTKLLIDLVERRQRLERNAVAEKTTEGISPAQYAAMRQVLMGDTSPASEETP